MIDRIVAKRIAADFLSRKSVNWSNSVRIDDSSTFEDGEGNLIVGYNSVDFLDNGNEGAVLGGNLPICVQLSTGDCRFISLDEFFAYINKGFI
jgi:hypothetical protein